MREESVIVEHIELNHNTALSMVALEQAILELKEITRQCEILVTVEPIQELEII